MKNDKLFLVLLICCIFITGCAESKVLERISLVTLIGYDIADDEKITATSVIRQINPEFESKVEIQSETNSTSKGTRYKVDRKTAKKIAAGQLRVVLFGEDLAKKGLEQSIHSIMMNNEISTSIYLAVVKGTSKSMLEYQYKDVTDIGQHVYNLIDHNVKQQLSISSTSHEIARDNYSKVRNFALPMLKKEGEFIGIDGVAFFSRGKLVGDLPAEDIAYIMMMQDNFKNGTLDISLDGDIVDGSKFEEENLDVAIDSIKTKRKMRVVDPEQKEFNLKIDMNCRLLEIDSSVSTSDPKTLKNIEQAMNKKIQSELLRIIEYSQEINSDIYGFGNQYKAQVRNAKLTEEKWYELFQEIKVNVDVNVEIIRNGVFE